MTPQNVDRNDPRRISFESACRDYWIAFVRTENGERSGDGNTLYAGNFMDRSVSVVSLSALLTSGKKTTSVVATVSTIGAEKLVPLAVV
jgi:sigma54-dependent transcription regulator